MSERRAEGEFNMFCYVMADPSMAFVEKGRHIDAIFVYAVCFAHHSCAVVRLKLCGISVGPWM